MPTIDYQPLANGASSNVVDQATFLSLLNTGGALQFGFQQGLAQSKQVNKVLRQTSMMSAAMANFISSALGIDVLDDGNLTTLIANLTAALKSTSFTTGDGKLTLKTVADSGWVMANDGTIGSATSGATTRANADTQPLYTLVWNNILDTWCPVIGGRGASATADFTANKPITLPKTLGRALAIAGAGSGLTSRALGQFLGQETYTLVDANISHTHSPGTFVISIPCQANSGSGGCIAGAGTYAVTGTSGPETLSGNTAFGIMQPSSFWNAMVKL